MGTLHILANLFAWCIEPIHAHSWTHSAFRRGCVGTVFSAALSYADVGEFYSLIIMNVIIKVGVDSENVSLTSEGLPILARLRAVYPMFLLSQLTDDFKVKKRTMCVCVCVCFLPIHSGHQARWTYQPGSHRRKVTHDFSSTFFLRCVPQFLSREGFGHSFPSSTVKSNFVY